MGVKKKQEEKEEEEGHHVYDDGKYSSRCGWPVM